MRERRRWLTGHFLSFFFPAAASWGGGSIKKGREERRIFATAFPAKIWPGGGEEREKRGLGYIGLPPPFPPSLSKEGGFFYRSLFYPSRIFFLPRTLTHLSVFVKVHDLEYVKKINHKNAAKCRVLVKKNIYLRPRPSRSLHVALETEADAPERIKE